MTTMTAAQYLESLQKQMYGDIGEGPRTLASLEGASSSRDLDRGVEFMVGSSGPKVKGKMREFRHNLKRADAMKPTRFEDPLSYLLMQELAQHLTKATEGTSWSVAELPVFGTLPVGELNAMALRVHDSNEYLIAFQDGVFGFANLLTKAVAGSLPALDVGGGKSGLSFKIRDVKRGWAVQDEPLRRLADLLFAFIVGGEPNAARQYFLADPQMSVASMLREGMELFIFGHELGHVVAGHLDDGSVTQVNLGNASLERIDSSWAMEYDADAIGCILALRALRNQGVDFAAGYCGIDLFFSALQIVDRARSVLNHGRVIAPQASHSHPPAERRRRSLRTVVIQSLDRRTSVKLFKLARDSERILNLMWKRIEPKFKDLHKQGARPAPMWQS